MIIPFRKYVARIILVNGILGSIFISIIAGQEFDLVPEYQQAALKESNLREADILATINKWHYELFPGNGTVVNPYTIACLLDSYAHKLAAEIKTELTDVLDTQLKIHKIHIWMLLNLKHTQGSGIFHNLPGDDPWGLMAGSSTPTYKKLLPSEMGAMSIYTGKISGKCYTLANLMATLMVLLGVNPDDVVVLQLWAGHYQHGIALAQFEKSLVVFNNESATYVSPSFEKWLENQNYFGFFNHSITQGVPFRIRPDFFPIQNSVIESVVQAARLKSDVLTPKIEALYAFKNRNDLADIIFRNDENSELFYLTKYSYQSLYVRRPEMYLKASLRTSRPRDLARSLKSVDEVFSWMKTNISTGSIFEDSHERLMTAEQVIVFRRGSLKDQAVLALILLKHKGYKPLIKITHDNAYLEFDQQLYEAKSWQQVNSINGQVELVLTLDPQGAPVEHTPANINAPLRLKLNQNFPNPFNARTTIDYYLPEATRVVLKIVNQLGAEIRTLVDTHQLTGSQQVVWDGKDKNGQAVSSGIYFYILETEQEKCQRSMLLIR